MRSYVEESSESEALAFFAKSENSKSLSFVLRNPAETAGEFPEVHAVNHVVVRQKPVKMLVHLQKHERR